jgi:nucleoside-diphosphate-sugar epimerase
MKKVLITGASGFIGSFLVEEALARGCETWAGIRGSSSRMYLGDERIRTVELDLGDKDRLCEQVAQCGGWDWVIHNAGVTKCADAGEFERVNFGFSKNLIEALEECSCVPERFVLMSSLSAHHAGVQTRYGDSKLRAEGLLEGREGFPSVILCPTGVYGPRDRDYFLVLKMLQAGWDVAAGVKPQQLSFIYVKDLAQVALLAAERGVSGRRYFVSDGATYSDAEYTALALAALGKRKALRVRVPLWALRGISTVAEEVARWRGVSSTLNRDKYKIMRERDWTCPASPLAEDLGFRAAYSLKRGLEESVRWYVDNGWL